MKSNYFDLIDTKNDINTLTINKVDHFNCNLIDKRNNNIFSGFLLGKSPKGNRYTLCDVDFHRSNTDGKYQPRLIFRKVDASFNDTIARLNSKGLRIPFSNGEDGYREFWKMISFLFSFKETVDFGMFDGTYQVVSSDQLKSFFNDNKNLTEIEKLAGELKLNVSDLLRTKSTVSLLKNYKQKIEYFIKNNVNEKEVQNWIDEDNHKFRQQRCLIFGLEYINFKREGSLSSKNFDVLTKVGSKHIENVLIELKSPSDDIFEIESSETINDKTYTYKIHKHLARAIPQILEYKSIIENKKVGDPELEKLGIYNAPRIAKCIVIIGKHSEDPRWKENRDNLVKSLNSGLEIWTYTELLNKIDATISNLERINEHEW